jgi:uncharacterized protein (DUF433 family)
MSSQIVTTSLQIVTIKDMVNYQNIITRNPNKRLGKPCVRETRISVYDVLNWLANGMTKKNIIEDFPELTENDILACSAYAADKEHKISCLEIND